MRVSCIPVVGCRASVLGVAQSRVKRSVNATRQRERNAEDGGGVHVEKTGSHENNGMVESF